MLRERKNAEYDSAEDDGGAEETVTDVFFVKEELAADDGDEAAALFDQGHDGDTASGDTVGGEECSVTDHEHDGEKPDPSVFPDRTGDLRAGHKHIDQVKQQKKKHIPELKLSAADMPHQEFVHETGDSIQHAGSECHENESGRVPGFVRRRCFSRG